MRFILPAALAAAVLVAGSVPALASKRRHRPPERARSHISLHVSGHDVVGGRRLLLRGRVRPHGPHRVRIVVRGPRRATVGTTSRRSGAFALRWRPRGLGSYEVRAYGLHDRRVRASVSPARRVTAYRTAAASYYGPGLYGGALACGGTLQPGTLGVANKTLPCGSKVRLRYRGRSITVPVVDRGPYVAGRDFDLTAATRARLHFPSTGVLLSSR
jgi:peptidoglycan lytic transglycosylase